MRLSQHISSKHEEQIPLLLAQAQQAAGHPAAAAHALSPLLERDPNNLPALLTLQRTAATAGEGELEGRVWLRIATLLREPEASGMAYRRAGALFEALAQPQLAACAYRRALAAQPNDEDLMSRLEEAYRDSHDSAGLEELVGLRIRRAEEPSRLVSLLFARAELRSEHVDDLRGAACDLLRVLQIDSNSELALGRLAALCDQHGDLQRAELYYGRLLETSHALDVRRCTVLQLTDVLARQGRLESAASTCRRYLESYPQQEEVWEKLVEIYLDSSEPRHALGALKRLSELPASPGVRAARLRRLARFHWQQLGDLRQARDALILALEADATDLDVLADLRRVCRELGLEQDFRQPVERAKAEIRQGIGRAPLDIEQYERLLRLAEWSEDQHTLLGALGVLCCLNAAPPAEQQLYRRRMEVAVFEPQRQLPSHAWYDSLVTREARGALGEIWRVVAEAVPKIFPDRAPSDLGALGVGRDDRISLETGGAILRLAQALNIGDFELYVTRQDARAAHGIWGDPPQLVVSYTLLNSRAPVDRFVLGRALYLLRDGAMAVEALSTAELEQLLASAVYAVEPSALKGRTSPELGENARQLQRVLSRRSRRALPLAVNRLLQEGGGFDVEGWSNGVLMSANRAAFLVCGNVVVAMQQLVQELGDPTQRSSHDNLEILQRHALAAQLLPFSVSTQYLELRQALRI